MLDRITPLILTFNGVPNIARTLEQLRWARDIVVIDSFSDDETLEIVSRYPQARVLQRKFDSFAAQCNFGLRETGIESEWVLSLDADYVLTPELIEELASLRDQRQACHGRRLSITTTTAETPISSCGMFQRPMAQLP